MTAPTDPNCIFCKIVAGQVPCHKLHEDEHVLAFLDVMPLSRGHTLIIPKGHYVTLDQVPDEIAGACMRVAPRLARAVMKVTGTPDYNILQNNGKPAHQAVGHVHFHIIPKTGDQGLGIGWPAGKLESEQGQQLAQAIVAAL